MAMTKSDTIESIAAVNGISKDLRLPFNLHLTRLHQSYM